MPGCSRVRRRIPHLFGVDGASVRASSVFIKLLRAHETDRADKDAGVWKCMRSDMGCGSSERAALLPTPTWLILKRVKNAGAHVGWMQTERDGGNSSGGGGGEGDGRSGCGERWKIGFFHASDRERRDGQSSGGF